MYKPRLTLKWLEATLRLDGVNAKEKVCNKLRYATEEELMQLRQSINERINEMRANKNE